MKRRLTSSRAWARKDIAYNISLPEIVAGQVKMVLFKVPSLYTKVGKSFAWPAKTL